MRLSFGGGGTDIEPYCTEYGGITLSATISNYAYTTWILSDELKTSISAPDIRLKKQIEDLSLYENSNLIEATLKKMKVGIGGEFQIHCDAPPGSGLGTSSAVNVSLIGAVWEGMGFSIQNPFNMRDTKYKIASLAYDIERKEMKIKGGYQDQYASSFGGFNWIEYRKDGSVHVSSLNVSKSFKNELQSRLLLCSTGKTRLSGNIIEEQQKKTISGENIEFLHKIKEIAYQMKEALENEDIDEFAKLLDKSWQQKRNVAEGISNPFLDNLYETAIRNGAIGGKVSGAGGGGFMYFIVKHPIQKIQLFKELQKVGIDYDIVINKLPVRFEDKGVYTWRAKE